MLLKQTIEGKASVEVEYKTVVREKGHPKAVKFIEDVFEHSDSYWRGIGMIPGSGLNFEAPGSTEMPRRSSPSKCRIYPSPKAVCAALCSEASRFLRSARFLQRSAIQTNPWALAW